MNHIVITLNIIPYVEASSESWDEPCNISDNKIYSLIGRAHEEDVPHLISKERYEHLKLTEESGNEMDGWLFAYEHKTNNRVVFKEETFPIQSCLFYSENETFIPPPEVVQGVIDGKYKHGDSFLVSEEDSSAYRLEMSMLKPYTAEMKAINDKDNLLFEDLCKLNTEELDNVIKLCEQLKEKLNGR